MRRPAAAAAELTVVLPWTASGGEELGGVVARLGAALAALPRRAEILVVAAGEGRATAGGRRGGAAAVAAPGVRCRVLFVAGPCSDAGALAIGLRRARGETVVVVGPASPPAAGELAAALDQLDAGADLVLAERPWRPPFVTRLAAALADRLVAHAGTGHRWSAGGGFLALRPQLARTLDLYGNLHRFVAALARHRGFRVVRLGLGPGSAGGPRPPALPSPLHLVDLATLFFLVRFSRMPLRFFGLVGGAVFAVGFAIDALLAWEKIVHQQPIGTRPLLLLGTLLVVLGVQVLSLGLVGELLVYVHARHLREYRVAESWQGVEETAAQDEEGRAGGEALVVLPEGP